MKIEFHNAHGDQLVLTLNRVEAAHLISKITQALGAVLSTEVVHYAEFDTVFENDNDRWEPTKLDIVVEADSDKDCVKV